MNTVTISGMFGDGHTYFANSPVVINVSNLYWGDVVTSPFTIVEVKVLYNDKEVGLFKADTGGQTSIEFDISSALRAIWHNFDFNSEVAAALVAKTHPVASYYMAENDADHQGGVRAYRPYSIIVECEYIASDDGGIFTRTSSGVISGGRCAIGGFTEWERSLIDNQVDADVSYREHRNMRNGDASTKPTSSPERVGIDSITSWVDVQAEGTKSVFYPSSAGYGYGTDDSTYVHAPIVLRDSIPYTDFLFVNRRGALETCSALMLESLNIDIDVQQYSRVERPTFRPSRSLMAIPSGGRRSWQMSCGAQTREWAEWWTMEFLRSRQWWMFYSGRYIPVSVKPSKNSVTIYDRSKQQMPSVDFTVTMSLEG